MRSYTNPLGKGRRVWSGKNTPSRGTPGSAPASLRHGDNVESLIDAKFAKWQEEQLAMFRGVLGPALPAQLPPGLPLRSLGTENVSGADIDLPDGDTDLESQAKSVRSIYDLYDNSICPDGNNPAPKLEADGSPVLQMVTSSVAPASPSAPMADQATLDQEHPAREMVTSSLAPGAPAGRQMVTSSVGLGEPDPLTGAVGESSLGTLSGPQSKAVGTHSSSSRAQQEGLREAVRARMAEMRQSPSGARSPASHTTHTLSVAGSVAPTAGEQATLGSRRATRARAQPSDFVEVSTRIIAVFKQIEKVEMGLGSLRRSHEDPEASTAVELSNITENLEQYKK